MARGVSNAYRLREKMLTESDFKSGKITSISLIDAHNHATPVGEDSKTVPVYGETCVEFPNGVTARIPCTVEEAQEYKIGQRASIDLDVDDEIDDEDDDTE